MTAEQAFDTPNYAATSARLADAPDEQPKAVEQDDTSSRDEAARRDRERLDAYAEIQSMSDAYNALRNLDRGQLDRALRWLGDRLYAQFPREEPPF